MECLIFLCPSLDYTLTVTRRPELLENKAELAHELVLRFAREIL